MKHIYYKKEIHKIPKMYFTPTLRASNWASVTIENVDSGQELVPRAIPEPLKTKGKSQC